VSQERRYGARHRIDLPVYIRYRRRPFLGASAHDVSVGGMFLSVHSLILPVGTPVELEFSSLGRDWLIAAVVIHGDNTGIGVMFREPQPELFQGLMAATDMPLPPPPRSLGTEADYRS
jgi:hypothetical protein